MQPTTNRCSLPPVHFTRPPDKPPIAAPTAEPPATVRISTSMSASISMGQRSAHPRKGALKERGEFALGLTGLHHGPSPLMGSEQSRSFGGFRRGTGNGGSPMKRILLTAVAAAALAALPASA